MSSSSTHVISKDTATSIALAWREIETAETLLADIEEALQKRTAPDIRDAFGMPCRQMELGVPSGGSSQRLFGVRWELARLIIKEHITAKQTEIAALCEMARLELSGGEDA